MKPTDEEMERVLASADRLAASGAALVKAVGELGGRVVMSPQAFDALLSRAQAAEARAEEAEKKYHHHDTTLLEECSKRRIAAEAANATLTAQVEGMRGALANLLSAIHYSGPDADGYIDSCELAARQALALPRGEG